MPEIQDGDDIASRVEVREEPPGFPTIRILANWIFNILAESTRV